MTSEQPDPSPAPSREVACLRAAIDGLSREVEKPEFVGGATSTIKDEHGEVEAMCCAATGWRAAWLVQVMQLLNDAVSKAVGDLRTKNEAAVAKAAAEAARSKEKA